MIKYFNISIFVVESRNIMNKNKLKLLFIAILGLLFSGLLSGYSSQTEKDESHIKVVLIDPGHGGKDWGASMGNAKEKDIVLDIALKLGNTIKNNFPDIKIIYTRETDVFIPLYERANIANKSEADLFISIHVNAVNQRSIKGAETFVLGQHRSKDNLEVAKKENSVILLENDYDTKYEGFDPNSPESYIMFELVQNEYLDQSVMFASDIQDELRRLAKRVDRSVKQAGFLVLRRTTMPSVLIETGFLSHTEERNFLISESGKTKIATSIFNAFKKYKTKIEAKSSFNLISENKTSTTNKNNIKPTEEKKIISEPIVEKQKVKIDKPVEVVEKPIKKEIKVTETSTISFAVQIMALRRKLEIKSENFKGEKNIFIIESEDINRYYSGKYNLHSEAQTEMKRLQDKYPGAFLVAFENNKLISVKKTLGKM